MKNKKSKSKLISVSLLALCFSMLAFGVYALKNATLTVQGTVGFTAHDCLVRVSASIAGDAVVEENEELVPNQDGTPSETRPFISTQSLGGANSNTVSLTSPADLPQIYFSDLTATGVPEVITITFSITNDSFYAITASITSNLTSEVVTDTIAVPGKVIQPNATDTLTVTYTLGQTEGDYVDFDSALSYGIALNFGKYVAPVVPTNPSLSGDALSFTAVTGASGYEVAYFDGNTKVSSYEINSNSVTLANKPETAGTYTVKVRTKKVEGGVTSYSDYVTAGSVTVAGQQQQQDSFTSYFPLTEGNIPQTYSAIEAQFTNAPVAVSATIIGHGSSADDDWQTYSTNSNLPEGTIGYVQGSVQPSETRQEFYQYFVFDGEESLEAALTALNTMASAFEGYGMTATVVSDGNVAVIFAFM